MPDEANRVADNGTRSDQQCMTLLEHYCGHGDMNHIQNNEWVVWSTRSNEKHSECNNLGGQMEEKALG